MRPKKKWTEEIPSRNIPFRVSLEMLERLDGWATRLHLSREQLIRNFIDTGIDDITLAHSIGLLSLVQFVKTQQEKGKNIEKILPCFTE